MTYAGPSFDRLGDLQQAAGGNASGEHPISSPSPPVLCGYYDGKTIHAAEEGCICNVPRDGRVQLRGERDGILRVKERGHHRISTGGLTNRWIPPKSWVHVTILAEGFECSPCMAWWKADHNRRSGTQSWFPKRRARSFLRENCVWGSTGRRQINLEQRKNIQ